MLALVPNVITVVRIVLVLPTAWLLWEARYVEALILTAVAGASDAVDGWIARRRGVASPFGARFDMELDALFVAVLSWAALDAGRAGPWWSSARWRRSSAGCRTQTS